MMMMMCVSIYCRGDRGSVQNDGILIRAGVLLLPVYFFLDSSLSMEWGLDTFMDQVWS